MKKIVLIFAISIGFIACNKEEYLPYDGEQEVVKVQQHKVVAYLGWWSVHSVDPEAFNNVTHVIYHGGNPKPDGTLTYNQNFVENLNILKEKIGDRDVKLIFDVVEWSQDDSGSFPQLAANPEARARFVQNLYNFCVDNDLDGFDMDWEWPINQEQWANAGKLLKELDERFSRTDKSISLALPPTKLAADGLAPFVDYIDWVSIMIYDVPKEDLTVDAFQRFIDLYVEAGIPTQKMIPGVPFYARNIDDWNDFKHYKELYNLGGDFQDTSTDEANGYYYNGYNTIAAKAETVVNNNCGGIMIWELSYDLPYNEDKSLLRAINSVISIDN